MTVAVHATNDTRGGGCLCESVTLSLLFVALTCFTPFALMAPVYSLCSCSEGLEGGQLPLEPWLDGLSGNSEVQTITLKVLLGGQR